MRLALFGDPVAHSRSPAMHRAALASAGLEGDYAAIRVDAADFATAVDDLREGRILGANVTMPHKRLAYEAADRVSADAGFGQTVNSLKMVGDDLVGITTDVPAIRALWTAAGLATDHAVVLGAGGAAAAGLVALAPHVESLAVSARRPESVEALRRQLAFTVEVHPWGEPVHGAIVNATPLGMEGEELGEWTEGASGLFDMAYGPDQTPAVAGFSARSAPVVAGLEMLAEQAALSFEWWTGRPAPREVMLAAAEA